jgi:exodeoxyribonuclease VII large subunit
MSALQPYTVGLITRYIKQRLEEDTVLMDVAVVGEVSNLRPNSSGHIYFTLKDEEAQLTCAMFKMVAMRHSRIVLKHGLKVQVRGRVSVYPVAGAYQLVVQELQLVGEGELHQRFLALKEKLLAEGLFAEDRKKALPRYPCNIGVVTSPTGAVVRDIINTLRRRYPCTSVLVVPTVVQGDGGADSIVRGLELLNRMACVDVIILARGGGSLEDLWCFNEERVARAIFASVIPVISGVGHETDFTIADFVADRRAATPTAAAEIAVPSVEELQKGLTTAEQRMGHHLQHFIEVRQQLLDDFQRQMEGILLHRLDTAQQQLEHMEGQMKSMVLGGVQLKRQVVEDMAGRLEAAAAGLIDGHRNALNMMELQLQSYDHRAVLSRGFSITTAGGQPVLDARTLAEGEEITTYYHQGKTISTIQKKEDDYGAE